MTRTGTRGTKKTYYRPPMYDSDREIRKAIKTIRKETGLDKAMIATRLMKNAISQASQIFSITQTATAQQ